jgi:hypothetical protein
MTRRLPVQKASSGLPTYLERIRRSNIGLRAFFLALKMVIYLKNNKFKAIFVELSQLERPEEV